MTKDQIQSFTLRISTANKTSMLVVIYDIAKTYIHDAYKAIEAGDTKGFRVEINRVRGCINELIESVNTYDELGMTLLRLYIFARGELTGAYTYLDRTRLINVERIIDALSDSYRKIMDKDKSGPVMTNAEKVYTGFTYGHDGLTSNLSNPDGNRGILA